MLDDVDRRLIRATQEGLPLVPQPYHHLAEALDLPVAEVMTRLRQMQAEGILRRIAAVPNHYALGYRFNGMTVWEVTDQDMEQAGERLRGLPFISHCYQRPSLPPDWPYTLFAMIHARDAATAESLIQQVAQTLGGLSRSHRVLFSTRILKKTGLRL